MNNDEFAYFFHGTTVTDLSLINEIFDNGLINYRGNDMLSTMWPIKITVHNYMELITFLRILQI